jgi:hypothetical protein
MLVISTGINKPAPQGDFGKLVHPSDVRHFQSSTQVEDLVSWYQEKAIDGSFLDVLLSLLGDSLFIFFSSLQIVSNIHTCQAGSDHCQSPKPQYIPEEHADWAVYSCGSIDHALGLKWLHIWHSTAFQLSALLLHLMLCQHEY